MEGNGLLLETVDEGYGGRADGGGLVGLPHLGGTGGAPSGHHETDSMDDVDEVAVEDVIGNSHFCGIHFQLVSSLELVEEDPSLSELVEGNRTENRYWWILIPTSV